jgi:hypothetical protein
MYQEQVWAGKEMFPVMADGECVGRNLNFDKV